MPKRYWILAALTLGLLALVVWRVDWTDAATVIRTSCPGADSTCVRDLVAGTATKDGLQKGFKLVEAWYASEPAFRSRCSSFVDTVGAAVAKSIPDYRSITFTPESVDCDYRFFQGYLTVLLASSTP